MIETKQNKTYTNREHLEKMMRISYNPREDLDRIEHSLDRSLNSKPRFNFIACTPEEKIARTDAWYDARIMEIRSAEQQYRQGITQAERTGTITTSEANRLLVDLSSPFPTNLFERARREAEELYRKEVLNT